MVTENRIESIVEVISRLKGREEELSRELDEVRAEKSRQLALLRLADEPSVYRPVDLLTPAPETGGDTRPAPSKRELVRSYIVNAEKGSTIRSADISAALNLDSNMVSVYMTQFADRGLLTRLSRGVFRVNLTAE